MLWYNALHFPDKKVQSHAAAEICPTRSMHMYDTCVYTDNCLDLHKWLLTCIDVGASSYVPPLQQGTPSPNIHLANEDAPPPCGC